MRSSHVDAGFRGAAVVRTTLDAAGLVGSIGDENVHLEVDDGVEAYFESRREDDGDASL